MSWWLDFTGREFLWLLVLILCGLFCPVRDFLFTDGKLFIRSIWIEIWVVLGVSGEVSMLNDSLWVGVSCDRRTVRTISARAVVTETMKNFFREEKPPGLSQLRWL